MSNVVFMGMGEPLSNLKAVKEAALRMHREIGVPMRRMTVSTVGIVPSIRKFAGEIRRQRAWEEGTVAASASEDRAANVNVHDDQWRIEGGDTKASDDGSDEWDRQQHEDMAALRQLNLAVSLHAATDEQRSKLVSFCPTTPVCPEGESSRETHAIRFALLSSPLLFSCLLFSSFLFSSLLSSSSDSDSARRFLQTSAGRSTSFLTQCATIRTPRGESASPSSTP